MRASRGAGEATAPRGCDWPPLQAKSCTDAEGRRALEPRRRNRTRHQKLSTPSRQIHVASAFEQRRSRKTRIRSTPCLEAVQNGRVASRAHCRSAHHRKTLAHRETKDAQSSEHTSDELERRGARGTQNTRARDTLAAADLTRMMRPRRCNGRI